MFTVPIWLYYPLTIICQFLTLLIFSNLIFYTILSLFGLKTPKRNYELVDPKRTFLFIIPAHNEELVITESIQSMYKQNYPKELFDIVCVADNCTDGTVEAAKKAGAIVYENKSGLSDPRGKPHGIANYLDYNGRDWRKYDYVTFIDADNYVDSNYLREMNSQLEAFPNLTVIQGYLGIKNVFSSLTATGYAAVYYITNRAVQYAKQTLGWNAAIGGTGFILSTEYLEEFGWNPRSYTEDFELQVELAIKGKKTSWNHWAKIYDEKPNTWKASHNQRKRWAQGHWYVGITKTPAQIKGLVQSKSVTCFLTRLETLMYSYSMVRPIAFLIIGLLVLMDSHFWLHFPGLFSLLPFWVALQILNFGIIPFVYCFQEGSNDFESKVFLTHKVRFMIRLLACFLWNSFTYAIVQIIGFFTWHFPQNKWVKTEHTMGVDKHVEK